MSAGTVANYAGEIIERCNTDSIDSSQMVQGQVFDSDESYKQQGNPNQYNILLGKWDC
jgi:hypothetical protein